jgi:hypothetical protein
VKTFFGPVQIVGILFTVAGALLRQPAIAALGVIMWIGGVATSSIKQSSDRHTGIRSRHGRYLLQPIQKLHDDVRKLVEENKDNATVRVIGQEALAESGELLKRATALAELLHDSRSATTSLTNARQELAEVQKKMEASTDQAQRQTYQLAIDARQSEVDQYEKLLRSIDTAKGRLMDAEVAMTAIKAQLAASVLGGSTDGLTDEDLSGMVGRLKSLSSSLDEVEEMRERIR